MGILSDSGNGSNWRIHHLGGKLTPFLCQVRHHIHRSHGTNNVLQADTDLQ